MRIELLHIDDCPNTEMALEQVRAALAALGRQDVPVHLRRIKIFAGMRPVGRIAARDQTRSSQLTLDRLLSEEDFCRFSISGAPIGAMHQWWSPATC